MDISSRWYGAAGASIVAAGITARYVAKWRRRRSLRRSGQGVPVSPSGRYFIGLDLADPHAAKKRPSDVAVLDPAMHCTFDQWVYREDGSGIIPGRALGRAFVLAVDGPQGLAGDPEAIMRDSERLVNAPGHTPYELPKSGTPYAGLIKGSVELFYKLVMSGSRFRLLGMEGVPPTDANLIEVFPGGAWKVVAGRPLPTKRHLEGRQVRFELLRSMGITFDSDDLPSTDQLDAAMAAWIAYCFDQGDAKVEGKPPSLDEEAGAVREGYVVQPASVGVDLQDGAGVVAPV
ncbi:MAG: DUF429 domain-containing protein [Dehalococcoidia bacterium]